MPVKIHPARDVAALLITVILAGSFVVGRGAHQPNSMKGTGLTVRLATSPQVAAARDVLDPASQQQRTVSTVQEEAAPSAPQTPPEVERPPAADSGATAEDADASRPGTAEPVRKPVRQAANSGLDPQTDRQSEARTSEPTKDRRPAATEVESRPKKEVEAMSLEEIREAVNRYRQWFHSGQIGLVLDHSQLSPTELASLVDFWILTSDTGNRLRVDHTGLAEPCGDIREGMLVGDLDAGKWPPPLRRSARSRLGPGYRASAQFLLRSKAALMIYRQLAKQIGGQHPVPGTEFVLRLGRDDRQGFSVKVVGKKYPESAHKELKGKGS